MRQADPADSASKSDSTNGSDAAPTNEAEEGALKRQTGYPGGQKKAAHSNIYIRGLAEDVNEEGLLRLVQPFGGIQSIRIYNAKKTLSFGVKCCFAFVKFRTVQEASAAIAGLDGTEFAGNMIQVRFAVRDVEASASAAAVQRPPASDNIYCKNLPASLRESELRQVFSAYGGVTSCRILRQGNATGLGGAALVRFLSVEEANCAVESLQGHRFPGSLHPLIIRFADSEEMKERKQASRQGEGPGPSSSAMDAPKPATRVDAAAAGAAKLGGYSPGTSGPLDALPRDPQPAHVLSSSPHPYQSESPGWHSLAYRPHALQPMHLGGAGMEPRDGAADGHMERGAAGYHSVPVDPSDPSTRYIHMPMQVSGSATRPSTGFHVGYGMPHVHGGYMHVPAPMMTAVPTGSYYHQGMMAQPHLHSVPQPWNLPHATSATQPGTVPAHPSSWAATWSACQEAAQAGPSELHTLHPVLVTNLPDRPETEERLYLYECFAPFGAIASLKMVRDKKGGRQRSGLINFTDADAAQRAVATMDSFPVVEGCTLAVTLCKPGPGGTLDERFRAQ